MPEISSQRFKQIVVVLAPQLDSEAARCAMLDEALGFSERANSLKQQLDFSGSTRDFTAHLVRELIEYGTLDSGELALIAVLRAAKAQSGKDKREKINRIISYLQGGSSSNPTPPKTDVNIQSDKQPQRGLSLLRIIGGLLGLLATFATIFAILPNTVQDRFWVKVGLLQSSDTPTLTSTPTTTETLTSTITASPTETSSVTRSPTPINTNTATSTTISTLTPSATVTATIVFPSNTPIPIRTVAPQPTATDIAATNTETATSRPITGASGQYPCNAEIVSDRTNDLNIIYVTANGLLEPIGSVQRGDTVTVIDEFREDGRLWYQIVYDNEQKTGWVWENYVELSATCP